MRRRWLAFYGLQVSSRLRRGTLGTLYVKPRKRFTTTGSIVVQVRVSNNRAKGARSSFGL